jgi:MFS family permease
MKWESAGYALSQHARREIMTPSTSNALPDDPDEQERIYDQAVDGSLRRNFLALLGHGMFGMTGFRLLQAPTFLPAYIFLLSGSELIVGLALAAQHIGSGLASIPGGNLISHRKRVLPLFFTIGALMRLQILGIALAGYFLTDNMALVATCIFLGLFGLFNGAQMVMFQYTMSKLIPVSVRGRLTGFRNFVSGIISSAVAYLGGSYFIDHNTWGNGYSTTFLLAFVLTVTGLFMLLGIKEPEPPRVRERTSLVKHAREIPSLLRQHRGFSQFLIVRSVGALSMAAVPFYVLFAGEHRTLTGSDLGILSVAFLLAQTMSNFLWGYIADHRGNRLIFMGGIVIWAVSAILLLVTPHSLFWLCVSFSGLGIGLGGYQIGSTNLILELGTRQNLPMLLGVGTAVNSSLFAAGPIFGGLLVEVTSYNTLITATIMLKILALALTYVMIEEPRHQKRESGP